MIAASIILTTLVGCGENDAPHAGLEVLPEEIVPLSDDRFEGSGELIMPPGFRHERVMDVLDPTDIRLLPDGTALLVTTKGGELLSLPLGDGSSEAGEASVLWSMNTGGHPGLHESSYHDLGLMGIAVDPGWPEQPFLYVTAAYVSADPRSLAAKGFLQDADYKEHTRSALFRLRLDDEGRVVTSARITPEYPSARYHNIGHLDFAADGSLYVSMGDALRLDAAQDPASPLGKILRLKDPANLPPAGHESQGPGAEISVLGVRNGFGLSVTSRDELLVPDNGDEGWDELYVLSSSELDTPSNLEHPFFEGFRPSEAHRERRAISREAWEERLVQMDLDPQVRKPYLAWEVTICPTAAIRLGDTHLPDDLRGAILQVVGTPGRYGTSGGRPRLGEVVIVKERMTDAGEPYRYAKNFLHCREGCGTPTSLRQAPDGSLLLATYLYGETGAVYRIWYQEQS